jgi:hypothetical protein
MTSFQEQCLQILQERAAVQNMAFDLLEISGKNETFYHGKLGKVEFWIYEDMADMNSNSGGNVFERPDYDSQFSLINAFVNVVLKASVSESEQSNQKLL